MTEQFNPPTSDLENPAPTARPELLVDPQLKALGAIDGLGPIIQQERSEDFTALSESQAIAATQELFRRDRLLARALDEPNIELGTYRLEFHTLDTELSTMDSPEGMRHVSSTLLVAGERIAVYKPLGFLVDSNMATVEHVAKEDSSSRTNAWGNLVAAQTNLTTLGELVAQVRAGRSRDMNEVNITLGSSALRGLFATNNPRARLNALTMQQHILHEDRGMLPLFVYDQQEGSLQSWVPTAKEVVELLDAVNARRTVPAYREALSL